MTEVQFIVLALVALVLLRIIIAIGIYWIVLLPVLIVGGIGYWIGDWTGAFIAGGLAVAGWVAYFAIEVDWSDLGEVYRAAQQEEQRTATAGSSASSGSVVGAILIMFVLSILLSWIPVLGPVIAGIFGGRAAGNVISALVAVFLPAIVLGVALFALASSLSGLPVIGAIAGAGGVVLALSHVGPLLVGAIIGGLLA